MRFIFLRRLARDRGGSVSFLVAGSMTMLIGAAALAVDIGYLYVSERKLQGIADAAAMAAAVVEPGQEQARALHVIAASCDCGIRISELTPGHYERDKAIDPDARFQPGDAAPNALRITVERERPLFLGRFLLGRDQSRIHATAIGSRPQYTAFSLGSRVAAVSGGIPNAILSALTGSSVNLSVMDYNDLLRAEVDLLHFADALRIQTGQPDLSFGQILEQSFTAQQLLAAMQAASSGPGSVVLGDLADAANIDAIIPAHVIDLGPKAPTFRRDPANPVIVDAATLMRALLQAGSAGKVIKIGVNAGPGLTAQLSLVLGSSLEHSPLIAISRKDDILLRTAQTRVFLDVSVNAAIARIELPLFVELGSATARLDDVDCAAKGHDAAVTLAVTASPATAAIGKIQTDRLADMSHELEITPARLLRLPLVSVTGRSELTISDEQEKSVDFTKTEAAEHIFKTMTSSGAVDGLATSLISELELKATVLGLGLPIVDAQKAVGTALKAASPALDGVIEEVLAALGLHLGQADTQINLLQCGRAVLVG